MRNLYYLTPPERTKNPKLADEFRQKPLKEWISALPAANLGLTIRKFHDRIVEMNAIEIDPEVLLEALDTFYPVYQSAEEFLLGRLIGKSYPLASDEQKIGQLAEVVGRDYLIGYSIVLKDMSGRGASWRFSRSLPRVVSRLIRCLSRILLLRYLLRLPEPEWIWLDLHALYLLAVEKEKQDTKLKEEEDSVPVSIETLYKQILLLRLADPWGLGHREIFDIYESSENWSDSVALKLLKPGSVPQGGTIYADEDKPPSLKAEDCPDSRVYSIEMDGLLAKLSELLERSDRSVGRFDLVNADSQRALGFPAPLLEYLRDRWFGADAAQHNLFEDRNPRVLSIGLKATHQQLNPPTNPTEKILADWLVTVNEDQSLRCEFDQAGQIFLGSLVSLKLVDLESARRVLGVVNRIWMHRLDGAVNFQISVLSPQVLAAGIQPVMAKKELQVYQRALLYFSESSSGRKANLVLESQKLKSGNVVQLLSHEDPMKVRLDNRNNIAPGFWSFECIRLVEAKKETIPAKGYDFL